MMQWTLRMALAFFLIASAQSSVLPYQQSYPNVRYTRQTPPSKPEHRNAANPAKYAPIILPDPLPIPAALRQPPYAPPKTNAETPAFFRNYQPAAVPVQPAAINYDSYKSPLKTVFQSGNSLFAERSFELPPSPVQLGFPAVTSTEENWNFDVNWNDFSGRRTRRSPQRGQQQHRQRGQFYQDNIAVEARQSVETRVPAPSATVLASRERPEREGNADYKQEYDGPYVYTQLFGPPYEVGYIRSPIPSKHVYEDYLQFVRSWSSASRDAVDAQIRANPSLAKEYAAVKYAAEQTPAKKENSYDGGAPDVYKEPESKKPNYEESAYLKEVAYKKPEYVEPAYKEPANKEPVQKGPAYSEPSYKEAVAVYKESTPAYKEPVYAEPSYKESAPAYKEPAYEEPSYKEPAYKEPAYSEPSYKEPAAYPEFAYKEKAPAYKEPAYAEPSYKEPTPVYKEPVYPEFAYKEKAPAYKEPAYAEPSYKEPTPSYKEPTPSYKEPEYKEAPAYKEPSYKEEVYQEPVRKEPVFRGETYREAPSKEPSYKETSHKSPAYKEEEEYKSPAINYHSPPTDYVAPDTEFRPANRPYSAAGPKSPVLIERDFVPIKSQQQYEAPTTYRSTTSSSYNDAPGSYDILKPFERARPSATSSYPAPPSYEAPTAVYEPVTTKYKPSNEPSYEEPNYEAPKRYETPRDSSKKYEAPPPRSPAAAYYQPPTRYVEPPQVKYESPAPYSDTSLYEAPNKYETPTKSAAAAGSPGYRIEPLSTPKYKDNSDDYAPSGYKDDVDLSSTSYQSVSQNYETPKEDYKPPAAYEQSGSNRKPEAAAESYSSGSYDESKKPVAAADSTNYDAPKKKHYPVIIGRYQVTDSSAFLPKKVGGSDDSGSGGEAKPVGSHIHGANGDEYVVYYLPYGQPLPVPVRRRKRSAATAEESIDSSVRRWRSLADGRRSRLRGQRQSEQEVLTPEEVHKKYPSSQHAADPATTTVETLATELPELAPVTEENVTEMTVAPVTDSSPSETVKEDEEIVSNVTPSEVSSAEIQLPFQVAVAEDEGDEGEALPIAQVEDNVSVQDEEPLTVDDQFVLAKVEEELMKSSLLAANPEPVDNPSSEPVGEIIVVKEVDLPIQPEKAMDEVVDVSVESEELVEPVQYHFKELKKTKKHPSPPAISVVSHLPGLTQKPVKYIHPPGIAAESKEEWNGYSTWWTKLGSKVAKHYNYE